MASTTNRFPLDATELRMQLNAALAETSELIQRNEDLDQQLTTTKEQLRDANVELEFSRSEVVDYRGYLTKWQMAEEERNEARRQRDDARQERDEARQQRDEARQESRELQANHANVLAENMRVKNAYTRQMTRFQEDVKKLKAQKLEILELKRQLSGRAIGVIGASSSTKDPSQENLNIQRNIKEDVETGFEKGLKRSHGEAFTEAVGESKTMGKILIHVPNISHYDLEEDHVHPTAGTPSRHPLSDSSQHNSPSSQRMSKRANTRGDAQPDSPLPRDRIRGPPVPAPKPSRILAESSQPDSLGQETEETVPLDIGRHGDSRNAKADQELASNLHDKIPPRLLVSPDSETAPEIQRKRLAQYLGTETKDPAPVVKREQEAAEAIVLTNRKTSTTPSTDRTLRHRTKDEESTKMNPPASVKRDFSISKTERRVKQETPVHSEASSRNATPATRSVDKRKLLPIPGWKGGRSSRALTRKDSFEDDDPLGRQASVQGSSAKKERSTPIQPNSTRTHVESRTLADTPVPAQKSTRMGKNPAIPAYMTTEMTRSRTTGSTAHIDRSSPLAGRATTSKIHSDPVREREMTPLADRNKNVRRGSEVPVDALRREDTSGGKVMRRGKEPETGGKSRDQAMTSKGDRIKAEEYEINPERNNGLNYAYQNVERRKEERKKLTGHGCIECENYYNAVGEMPVVSRAPIWRDPSPEGKRRGKCPHGRPVDEDVSDDEEDAELKSEVKQKLKNQISRHRDDWVAPSTPPMYWNIGFPSTQDVEEINMQAEQQRESKRAEMQREAEKKDGKYRRVAK